MNPTDDEEILRRLMQRSVDSAPPAAARAAARTAVEAAWRQTLAEQDARRQAATSRARRLALAAGIAAIALGATLWWSLERSGSGTPIDSTGGATLQVATDLTLRLAPGTSARWQGKDRLRLDSGRLLLAAGPQAPADFIIATPLGDVRHVGTRFVIEADAQRLIVAVREGRASVTGNTSIDVGSGQVLNRDLGQPDRLEELTAVDQRFGWLGSLPVSAEFEGRTLDMFLDWYANETGYRLAYADAQASVLAHATKLRGSVGALTADEALAAFTASADLSAHKEQGTLVIARTMRP